MCTRIVNRKKTATVVFFIVESMKQNMSSVSVCYELMSYRGTENR